MRKSNLPRRFVCGLAALSLLALLALFFFGGGIRRGGERAAPARQAGAAVEEDAVLRFRRERSEAREEELGQLRAIMAAFGEEEALRAEAAKRIRAICLYREQEAAIEGVLGALGYGDALASVREGSVNLIIPRGALKREESALILAVAVRETGQPARLIRILPIGSR